MPSEVDLVGSGAAECGMRALTVVPVGEEHRLRLDGAPPNRRNEGPHSFLLERADAAFDERDPALSPGLRSAPPGGKGLSLTKRVVRRMGAGQSFPWPDIDGGSNGNGGVYDSALLVTFQILGTLRRDHAPLRRGSLETLLVDDMGHLYAYLRATDTESLVVVLNNDPAGIAHEAIIPVGSRFPDGTRFGDLPEPAFSAEVSGGLLPVGVVPGTWGRVLQPLAP